MRLLLAVILGLTFSPGCTPAPKPEQTSLVIGVPRFSPVALVAVAAARGHFQQQGLSVRIHPYETGQIALGDVSEGKIQLAVSSETPLLRAILTGKSPLILGTVGSTNRSAAIVGRKDRGITTPADLSGKTIGRTQFSNADYILDQFLTAHAINPSRVKQVDVPSRDIVQALLDGTVDAVSTWQPYVQELGEKLGTNAAVFEAHLFYTEAMHLSGNSDFVRAHPGTIRAVLRALVAAEKDALSANEPLIRDVAKILGLQAKEVSAIWPRLYLVLSLDQALVSLLDVEGRWAHEKYRLGTLPLPDFLDFIYWEGLQHVAPEAITIVRPENS